MNKSEICNSFCLVFFIEKLRLGRRTAASCRDEALYTNRSGVFLLLNASETFFPARPNEEEFDDITKEEFSLRFFFFLPQCADVFP